MTLWLYTRAIGLIETAADRLTNLHQEDGFEVAQSLAMAAAGIIAILAIFAVIRSRGLQLINSLFDQLQPR